MYQLVLLFFEICMLRKGPQDVPASRWLARLAFLPYVLINLLILLISASFAAALLQLLVQTALIVGFTYPLLYFSGNPNRFPQTLTALLGCDAMITFFAIPAMASLETQANQLAYIAMLLLMAWHWLINGNIYRHALDKPLPFGLALALLYILISSQAMSLLFPELPTAE